jgi:hypothetical protein
MIAAERRVALPISGFPPRPSLRLDACARRAPRAGIAPAALTAIAVIAFGSALVLSSNSVRQLYVLKAWAARHPIADIIGAGAAPRAAHEESARDVMPNVLLGSSAAAPVSRMAGQAGAPRFVGIRRGFHSYR